MKRLAYGIAAAFTSLTLLGILFKTMHWPGAGIALVLGVSGISLIVIPIVSVYKFRSAK